MEGSPFGNIPQLSLISESADEVLTQIAVNNFVSEQLVGLLPASASLISIDGFDGVGKTTLARAIAQCTGATRIEVDRYLQKHRDCYLDAIDFDELERRIAESESSIIDGCLMLAVLKKLGLQPDYSLYLARTSRLGGREEMEWVEEYDSLISGKSASEIIQGLEGQAQRWALVAPELGGGGIETLSGLTKELIVYHDRFVPHLHANLIVKVVRIS